jgi:hypothetical protein
MVRKSKKKSSGVKSVDPEAVEPFGRPTKYDPKYCKEIIDFMGQGYSLTAFSAHIGVHRDTVYEWQKHPDFSDAVKQARAALELHLIDEGKKLMTGEYKGSAAVWIYKTKNMLGWRDRQELEINSNIDPEDLSILKSVDRKLLIEAATKKDGEK